GLDHQADHRCEKPLAERQRQSKIPTALRYPVRAKAYTWPPCKRSEPERPAACSEPPVKPIVSALPSKIKASHPTPTRLCRRRSALAVRIPMRTPWLSE